MKNHGYKPFVVGLVSLALVTGTYLFGYSVGHQNLQFEKGYKPTITSLDLGKPNDIDFSLFWDVWERVNDKYAGKVDNQQMVYDAINGALRSLDDPYTLFLPPEEAKRFNEDLKGSFDGIGAEIERRDGNLTVVAPLESSPAEKAGIQAKDIIVKIDGMETENMSLDEAIDKIRGEKGSKVTLTVARQGAGDLIEIPINRDTIVVKSVKWEIKNDNIGYIKVSQFGEDTEVLINEAIDEMLTKKPKGLIVDVRNNPGGFLDAAVDITSLFTSERGAIVKEENKDGRIVELKATSNPKLVGTPMVILVNGGSASASEIFAGALQDFGRAKLVGEKTFGKGSVQELESVKGGGALRVTIAKWLTPKGRQINKEGINPDVEIKPSEEDIKNKKDPQLDKAIELLNQ